MQFSFPRFLLSLGFTVYTFFLTYFIVLNSVIGHIAILVFILSFAVAGGVFYGTYCSADKEYRPYLWKLLAVVLVSSYIFYLYYFVATGHQHTYEGFFLYLLALAIVYVGYKACIIFLSKNTRSVSFNISHLFYLFLGQLFMLCSFFFLASGQELGGSIVLFLKIFTLSTFPIVVLGGSYALGSTVCSQIEKYKEQTKIFQFLSALGLGFSLFISVIVIIGSVGFYNLYLIATLLIASFVLGRDHIISFWKDISQYKITLDHSLDSEESHYTLSSEFLFIVLSLFVSANLISIVRPMPIGWDDLGVYMNYPNLMAQAGDILSLGGMYAWQVFTGIGYMTGSATQAFFFNSIGGSMCLLTMYLIFKDLMSSTKKTFINIPLLLVTVFASMPMVVFQLAKDMKIDPGLLFISSIALYIMYYLYTKFQSQKFTDKQFLSYVFVLALIVGFTFTMKFTSLLLISGILGLVFYYYGGLLSFSGYMFVYIAIFTKLGLWRYMNVSYPSEDIVFINTVFYSMFLIGIACIGGGLFKISKKLLKQMLATLGVIALGFIITTGPWFIKNISEADMKVSISNLIGGKNESFRPNLSLLYSDEKITEIQNSLKTQMTASGTTANEDFGRYFGYEEGINNYMRLPYNLTMQKNQKGEFTDITFIFLAFLPIIFLFLPYRRKEYIYLTLGVCSIGFLLYFLPVSLTQLAASLVGKGGATELMLHQVFFADILYKLLYPGHVLANFYASIQLPLGYIYIFGSFFLWFLLSYILDVDKKFVKLFQYNLIFALFYTFLWSISAFGIVWYGIVMYMSFLLMIGISLYYVTEYSEKDSEKSRLIKGTGSFIILLIFSSYFLMSGIPKAMLNAKLSGYNQFKGGEMSATESLFNFQNGYLEALFAMNINPEKTEEFYKDVIVGKEIENFVMTNKGNGILFIVNSLKKMKKESPEKIMNDSDETLARVYKRILHPREDYRNEAKIMRVGTFLKYYISENNSRLSEDSLITKYYGYFHDADTTKTLDNIKTVGLEYVLLDLNAATIDKDPRKNLTKRYEGLLAHMKHDRVQLLASDSVCLKLAIENYKSSGKTPNDDKNFMRTAGINYESYDASGKLLEHRGQKLSACYSQLIKIFSSADFDTKKYYFLSPIRTYLQSPDGQKIRSDQAALVRLLQRYVPSGRFALFKID